MQETGRDGAQRHQVVLKLAIVALTGAAIGLPINHLYDFLLLATAAIVLAVGRVSRHHRPWLMAVLVVLSAVAGKIAIDVPKIEEGHNVFLPDGSDNALVNGLPPDVFRTMAAEFERASPPDVRCSMQTPGCWQNQGRPNRVYAFSFDGVYDKPAYSRRVTGIDFSDAVWQRLGFVNELIYNWHTIGPDIGRGYRPRGMRGLFQSWRITMPHFVMFRFPQAFAGSRLCWRGTVLWEETPGRFGIQQHAEMACRAISVGDAGMRIYGLAIAPDTPLSMRLEPTARIRLLQSVQPGIALVVVLALLFLLVRWEPRDLRLPFTLVGLALLVMLLNDVTFLGGVRPFDAGNDGFVYDGWSRTMAQLLLAGEVLEALKGMEPVFHFTPGARYLRTVEHLIFGETYLGYVSLLLLLPFLVLALFRRHFSARTALAVALIFIAVPIGALFGSTYYQYVKYAAQGFGDPAAAIFFLGGVLMLIGRARVGPSENLAPAIVAGLLFALALFVRPNLAGGAAVLLGGAGLAALWQSQVRRLAGMILGFLPVSGMALHNWYYGGVFVPFSGHLALEQAIPAPPGAYAAAFLELLRFEVGENVARIAFHLARVLTGPSEHFAMVPLHALAITVLVLVLLSRRYEGWLRLIAGTALGLHAPALFFIYAGRYHHLAWLLTLLVCAVWVREEALPCMRRYVPDQVEAVTRAVAWLGRRLGEAGLLRRGGT